MLLMALLSTHVQGQVVYEPVANNPVYDLLDELALMQVIAINPVVKPYPRSVIAEKLEEALLQRERLNKRQLAEVEQYLKAYRFDLTGLQTIANASISAENQHVLHSEKQVESDFSLNPVGWRMKAGVFKIGAAPWIGGRYLVNENGSVQEATGGGELFGYFGRHMGYYASAQYTWQSQPLVNPVMFTTEGGKVWTVGKSGSVGATELRGGLSVAWKWGDIGLYHDRPVWGNGIHGANILSGKAPAFPYLHLHVQPARWIDFHYIHGLLTTSYFSSVAAMDTAGSYNVSGQKKFIVANMVSISPWRFLTLSAGNSNVYTSDQINLAFLLPVQFFKATDQTQTSISMYNGQNNQLFFAVDLWAFRMTHLWFSTFIEDLKMSALYDPSQVNELGWKAGFSLSPPLLRNVTLAAEYTRTNPLTYHHTVTPTNYFSDEYCLGHYMRDDSEEWDVTLAWRPMRGLKMNLEYSHARHGIDYLHPEQVNNYLLPFIGVVNYKRERVEANVSYRILSNVVVWGSFTWQEVYGDVKYTPAVMRGGTNTIGLGGRVGF